MASRSPPSSPTVNSHTLYLIRMMESILTAMQQQNVALVQQNTVTLQHLETARLSAEVSQRQYVDLMASNRATIGPPTSSVNHHAEWSLESFLQHHPAKFDGKCSLDEVDQWFRDMERICNAKRCPDENRLAYSEYMLTGEASYWCSSMRMLLESRRTPISWEIFKMKFYAEYFPDSVQFAKEVEFLELVQGGMTVSEYADRFKHLLRFHTLAMNEEWLCRKFENGLRVDLKLMVAGLCIKQFPSSVERAKVSEKNKMEVERQQPNVRGSVSSKSSLGPKRTPYARPSSSGVRGHSSRPPVLFGQQTVPAHIRCFTCGGPHYQSVCPQKDSGRWCNRCRSVGHYEKYCNMGRRASDQPQHAGRFQPRGGGGGGRAQAARRVYALTGTEATSSGNLIEFVEKLGFSIDELQFDMVVSTPTVGKVRMIVYCAKCPIVIEGRQFKVNLICLPLQGLEVILGIDWLVANRILIDCGEKKLLFPNEEQEESLAIGQLRQDILEGACCFLILSHLEVEKGEQSLDRSV
ncbi:uncharacterized protein LOC108327284 [Vigna angularis]|uniref:uncharacterized protein LOC108327284 n=1 Tax=Phaseolus angularis TaxID=3914 RepID=UPI00080A599C|nr:uncharacterized protein LOC108327284 [Vigna angularis]